MTTAYIALGANLGDRRANIERALDLLRATPSLTVTKISTFLENPAVGGPPDSPPFLNAVAEIQTTLSPRDLLARLLDIEKHLGRERRAKWDPRLIDLDLLLYGDAIIDEPDLKVPHPLMQIRRFVLDPLAEIAPDAMHPTMQRSIESLSRHLQSVTPPRIINGPTRTMSITIDTSAVIAVIGNETSKARILELTRDQDLVAPATLPWEIANAFSAMFKRRAIHADAALAALSLFERIPVRLVDLPLPTVVSIAASLNIYAYDACVIACAQQTQTAILTLDGGLRDAARRAGVETAEVITS